MSRSTTDAFNVLTHYAQFIDEETEDCATFSGLTVELRFSLRWSDTLCGFVYILLPDFRDMSLVCHL